jgi:peptidoglycan hydrolase-like protein with peptidoglycan-binding domain
VPSKRTALAPLSIEDLNVEVRGLIPNRAKKILICYADTRYSQIHRYVTVSNVAPRREKERGGSDMSSHRGRIALAILSLAMVTILVVPALGQRSSTVPVGTVISLRMDTALSSDTSRVGDRFTATVFRPAVVDGRVVIPENTKVEGHVTGATPIERGSRVATLAVAFDRIIFSGGSSVQIDGTLTALGEDARRQIEQDVRYQESSGRTRRAVVFLGASEGAGPAIGVAGGRTETTTVGAILGTLRGNGARAEVRPGTEFGLMVERSFTVDTTNLAGDRDFNNNDPRTPGQTVLTSADSVRSAQIALRNRNYYNGQANGLMNQATRDAISSFQHDRNLPATGELDLATARAIGIPVDVNGPPAQTAFTSAESIRFAQVSLRDRGYYTGPINGVMNQATRTAIRQLQRERNLNMNGDLDLSTARELGLASDSGIESAAIEIMNPRAERISAGSIRISADVHTQGSGWQVFVNRFVTGNTLHVYVRGVAPRYPAGSAVDHHPFTETYNDLPNVARVIIHGPQRDFATDLTGYGAGTPGSTDIGNPRQIALLAGRLLQDFQRGLNMRNNRGQVIFDTRRDFRPSEVEVLFQITSLQAAAELYNQLTASVTDPDAVKGAAGGLMRQSRLLERILRRGTQLTLSPAVSADWQQLQAEIARINITDANLDSDIVR